MSTASDRARAVDPDMIDELNELVGGWIDQEIEHKDIVDALQYMLDVSSKMLRESLAGLLENIKMHHDGACPGIAPADCLDAIYEAAEVARAVLVALQDKGTPAPSGGVE